MNKKFDYWGINASDLKKKKLFLLDMDGTIYQENRLFDGTIELLQHIRDIGGRYVFVTNNSSRSVREYIDKLNHMGIAAEVDDFYTSTQATITYLKKTYQPQKIYCMGTAALLQELQDASFEVVDRVDPTAEVILVGFDTELTSQKLRNTCEMLLNDIPFIATNPDLTCPVSFGFVPDCGSVCQMLFNATGRKPLYIGKPSTLMVNFVMNKFGYMQDETVIIGDRLYTDIATGLNAGVTAVCVLSGEATENDVKNTEFRPTYTFASVREILDCISMER